MRTTRISGYITTSARSLLMEAPRMYAWGEGEGHRAGQFPVYRLSNGQRSLPDPALSQLTRIVYCSWHKWGHGVTRRRRLAGQLAGQESKYLIDSWPGEIATSWHSHSVVFGFRVSCFKTSAGKTVSPGRDDRRCLVESPPSRSPVGWLRP